MNDIPKLTDVEFNKLTASNTEAEWNGHCDAIKRARGGQYPPDWYPKIIMPGVLKRTAAKWGGTGEICVTTIP